MADGRHMVRTTTSGSARAILLVASPVTGRSRRWYTQSGPTWANPYDGMAVSIGGGAANPERFAPTKVGFQWVDNRQPWIDTLDMVPSYQTI